LIPAAETAGMDIIERATEKNNKPIIEILFFFKFEDMKTPLIYPMLVSNIILL
jgi:hypothetical protein